MRKVKTKWTVNFSNGSKAIKKAGDKVAVGDELVEEIIIKEEMFNVGFKIEVVGEQIEQGKVMFKTKGIFPKKIIAPCTGTVTRIDEFNNVYVKTGADIRKMIKSPAAATVLEVEADKMVLEFNAAEYVGEGLNENRAWATCGLKWVNGITDLKFDDENKIIMTADLTADILKKAEVMGISGIVISGENKANIKLSLPVLKLAEEEVLNLKKLEGEKRSVLLNAGNDRLLLVI